MKHASAKLATIVALAGMFGYGGLDFGDDPRKVRLKFVWTATLEDGTGVEVEAYTRCAARNAVIAAKWHGFNRPLIVRLENTRAA